MGKNEMLNEISLRANAMFHKIQEHREERLKGVNHRTIALLLFLSIIFGWAYMVAVRPPSDFPLNTLVTIEKGETLGKIADSLKEQKIVRSATWLYFIVRARGESERVHAGDYIFKNTKNVFEVARIIGSGAFGLEPVKITIPEGATLNEIADILDKKLMRFEPNKFRELSKEYEGYLFPETYFMLPNITENEAINIMRGTFDQKMKQFEEEIKKSKYSLQEIIIMASIVEKEASNAKDRRLISGVLWNRIKIKMPLQVDATFVYTHDKGSSQITLAELKDKENTYNTYANPGLPPGPIGSPGLSSIEATLFPTESEYLFYLADDRGNTYFSKTFAEHLAKRGKYIK